MWWMMDRDSVAWLVIMGVMLLILVVCYGVQ